MSEFALLENVPVDGIDDRYSMEFYDPDAGGGGAETRQAPPFPPVLVNDGGRLSLFMGKRLLDMCARSGKTVPVALRMEKPGTPEIDFLVRLVLLKSDLKGFNVVEKAMAVKRFRDLGNGETAAEGVPRPVLDMLGLGLNAELVRNYAALAETSFSFKLRVLRRELHEHTAFEVFRFPREDWDRLAEFASSLFLGTKKRNAVVSMMHDISERDRRSAADLLADPELRRLKSLPLDPPHIAERIYGHFEKLRYPRMSEYRERFYEKLKETRLDPALRLRVPQDFETWDFSMEFRFSSVEEFQRKVQALQLIAKREAFRELMEMRSAIRSGPE